jgi:hypothetical protein
MHRPSPRVHVHFLELLLSACALVASAPLATAAPKLATYAFTVAGQSSGIQGGCSSFSNTPQAREFFGTNGVRVPGDLAACSIAGDSASATSTTGPLTSSRALNTAWAGGTMDGAAEGRADYGDLSASSHLLFTGYNNSLLVAGSESLGRADDRITITSPAVANGQAGAVKLTFTVVGGLSTTLGGLADVELNYQVGSGGLYTMFRSQAGGPFSVPFLTSLGGTGLGGLTLAPGSMSGTGTPSTFAEPIVFGTPVDLRIGLFTYVYPSASGSTPDAHFQAYISGITVTGPLGQPVADFTVTAESGAHYGAGGVTGVAPPDPADASGIHFTVSPNPTVAGARLAFALPAQAAAHLDVYDSAGRRVRNLREYPSGPARAEGAWWDGRNDRGAALPSGAYYARLRWPGGSRTVRVVISR